MKDKNFIPGAGFMPDQFRKEASAFQQNRFIALHGHCFVGRIYISITFNKVNKTGFILKIGRETKGWFNDYFFNQAFTRKIKFLMKENHIIEYL